MPLKQKKVVITEEKYLIGVEASQIKHEFYDGDIYAISGASKKHKRISGNFLDGLPFDSDIKVKVGNDFFYPEAMVICDDQTDHDYYTETTTVIVEVLAKSTREVKGAWQSMS